MGRSQKLPIIKEFSTFYPAKLQDSYSSYGMQNQQAKICFLKIYHHMIRAILKTIKMSNLNAKRWSERLASLSCITFVICSHGMQIAS
jgi:hypothetical protein